ncbi:MAG: hypothetical protein FJ144_07875 [Deltaproteobacteria bacterium]|nr:hypothetical protein [Deltaproteobacteria bacterium]
METSVWVRDERGHERGIDSLEPDHMTPEQFAGLLRRHSWRDGEHRLVAAVLQDAVETFQKHAFATSPEKRELFDEVYGWVTNREDHSLFAFTTVCEILGLDPDYLRGGLLRWLEQNRKRPVSIGARFLADPPRRIQTVAAVG